MIANSTEKNAWKVQPDTTVQVVDPLGIKNDMTDGPVNWQSILIALAIIFFVSILVALAAFLLIPLEVPPFYGRRLNLQDLSNQDLRASPVAAQWLSDDEFVFFSETKGLVLRNMENNTESILISKFTLRQIGVAEFSISNDRRYALLTHDIEKGRLFKRTAKFSIYDFNKHSYNPLRLSQDQLQHPRFQHAQWLRQRNEKQPNVKISSNGVPVTGSELTIVFENNIYILASPAGPSIQITKDGSSLDFFNGVPNLMNEEIMKGYSCIWPNPNGDLLAYVSFDDTKVKQIPVIEYGPDGHPNVLFLRYPTVNTPLPKATVWVAKVSVANLDIMKWELLSPLSLPRGERYVVAVGWIHDSKLWISEMSRDQGTTHLMTCDGGQGWTCTSVYVNHVPDGISPAVRTVVWLGKWAAFPWPIRTSNGWWYNHVTLVGRNSQKKPTLTLNRFHVKYVLATDSLQQKIYFLGSDLSEGRETQQLYSVTTHEKSPVCYSCIVGCSKVDALFNKGLSHVIITCIETYLPTMHLVDLENINISFDLHTQSILREETKDLALPIPLYKEISIDPSLHASVSLALPPVWKEGDESLFFPLVVHILGVENYEQTNVEQNLGLQDLLASRYSTAHARVSFWESDSYYHNDSIHTKALQMAGVIKSLLQTYPFLDGSHLSIWGWGSGASIALKMTELGALDLRCIMVLNPVMDWTQYGTYWSERMLGPLDSEGAGRRYEDSKIFGALDTLKETQIMLIQSTKDPLNHHSSGIASYLISRGIYFIHIVYPKSSVALREERVHVIKSFKHFVDHHKCISSFDL